MKAQFKRTDRIAEEIQRKLSQLIRSEIDDPHLPKLVTISSVDVSPDLGQAKIYFTVLAEENQNSACAVLNKASGHLRCLLAKSMMTRKIPRLVFIYDESIEYSHNLSKLIDTANSNEK